MAKFSRIFLITLLSVIQSWIGIAQVNSVLFGRNRLQFNSFKWQYYQTKNFNVYFYNNGQELAKFVAQSAEKELPQIEAATESSLQRRANIIVYNEFAHMQQTNIGLETDILKTGNTTKFVNNKMVVYFDANHAHLTRQIREGIAQVITQNLLFGDDIGEIAGNQTLLDLPQWFTDGYTAYVGENWSSELDDELKSELLSDTYKNFASFSNAKPLLAGHAFWYFIEEKYKKENVTYFFYLARQYKKLNKASQQITKLKFTALLKEFMVYESEKYYNDIARRKSYPKGSYIDGFTVGNRTDYSRFNVNPNKRNNSFVVTQYKKGVVRVLLGEDFEYKTLLKYGVRSYENELNPSYPMMAWDPKGTRIAIVYVQEGRLKLFVYDNVTHIKPYRIDFTGQLDQIQDIKYMLDSKTLLLSAVKNGHTDIYTYNLERGKLQQITNDVYDNLDASYVAFPGKTGIIFSSNRPSAGAISADTILPSNNRYNIFMITDFGDKPELNQISQLSNLKYGNARFPMQYNMNHFTFVSDENGIGNRYAGFFTSKKAGLDTLVLIGNEILRNPSTTEVDSTLRANKKTDVDSIAVVSVSIDSAYSFPITNYESSLVETRIAGDNNQVSEVTRQSEDKVLYKLKIDEIALNRRNVTAQPTEYAKKRMRESKLTHVDAANPLQQPKAPADSVKKPEDLFQNEFATDSSALTTVVFGNIATADENSNTAVMAAAKLYPYRPKKFSVDFGGASANNSILINKYQSYTGGAGPIKLNSSTPLNGLIRLATSDILEDIRITGAYKISTNLKDNEWYINYANLKRRLDWGITYYRNAESFQTADGYPLRIFTNLYQANISYPFDETKSLRLSTGIRSEKQVLGAIDLLSAPVKPERILYHTNKLEYVYDNSLNPTTNIWNGLRYKISADWNRQVSGIKFADGPNTFNLGIDARYYYPIYRNFIWAGRASADFSWGNQKFIYYLGGADGWLMLANNQKLDANGNLVRERYFNSKNKPDADQEYAFQSLALNMRGFIQNVANGNNAVVLNSEFRMPVMSTLFDKTVSNAFLRTLMLTQFIDLGTAWNGAYDSFKRPEVVYGQSNVFVKVKTGGVGPFAGGYGFGARSTLFGYFIKFDVGWPMGGFFAGRSIKYVSLGFDF